MSRLVLAMVVALAAELVWGAEPAPAPQPVAEELLGAGEPDAATLKKVIGHLGDADPALREAAIRRLAPHPGPAAGAVVEALAKGNLAVRLSCLELLTEWKAPVEGLDPWQPQTVGNERVKALLDWAAVDRSGAQTRPATLTTEEAGAARQEIARMLTAPEEEARAIRERRSRLGRPLMPEVLAALKEAGTDTARQRLLTLRYRLVASDQLALTWGGGLERLASPDAPTRHHAADELVARATGADGALLLELFADPDPLVREISLRGMRAVGKGDAAAPLIGLLGDPDANVRAAVLKQLAESPSPALVGEVVAFAAKEQDPDLVVHAARVLRHTKAAKATAGLMQLLGHASWRVRAEAAEALTELAGDSNDAGRQAEIYAAMIRLLDDEDGFVVSRAVVALQRADTAQAVEPMARAATKHPELAGDILKAMTGGNNTRGLAEKHIRALCSHASEQVRAQAIASLVQVSGLVEGEIKALLKDPAPGVRVAAASALFQLIGSWRPSGETTYRTTGGILGFGGRTVAERSDAWQWAADFRAGKGRPAWMLEVVGDLEGLMASPDPWVRVPAALPLLALAEQSKPLGVIRGAVRAEPAVAPRVAWALPWLEAEARLELFKLLIASPAGLKDLRTLADAMAVIYEPRAAMELWKLLGRAGAEEELAAAVYGALQRFYFGDRYYNPREIGGPQRQEVIERAKEFGASGTEVQKVLAMALAAGPAPDVAAELARKLRDDPGSSPLLRLDAQRVLLLSLRKSEGLKEAAAALSSGDADRRSIGLSYFVSGDDDLSRLRDSIHVYHANSELSESFSVGESMPSLPPAPPAEVAAPLRELARSADVKEAAGAGYLLALLGQRDGLDAVVRHWRASPKDRGATKLAYTAIAALNEQPLVPVLEQMYAGMDKDSYEVRQFYWTIRVMKGEQALVLRKKIRDEVGMENLR